jgi:Fe-S oxidoreductase
MNYNYPEVGRATVELLEMAGFEVMLADVQCCGRPMVSKGMLSRAKRNARANVDMLYGYIQEGAQIIGCEPSCLLTLTDEYPDLLNDDKSKVVARNSFLIDEFLVRIKEAGDLSIKFSDLQKNVLFHGHCHQKALRGSDFSLKALSLPPNYQVEMIDAGCCGMAGAFGYEKEHYELSMEIGKQRLFPAILSKGVDWDVAVMGVSCRQQIEHGIGKKARHLVEILREAAR